MWHGKPELKSFVFGGYNLLFIGLGLLFMVVSLAILVPTTISRDFATEFIVATAFALFLGVAISFGTVFSSLRTFRRTEYLVTDQRIIIKGAYPMHADRIINFWEAGKVKVSIGVINNLFGTGDIFVENPRPVASYNGSRTSMVFPDIKAVKEPFYVQRIILEAMRDYKSKK